MLIARKFIAINVIAYAIIILQESPAVADIRRSVSVLVGFYACCSALRSDV